MGIAAPARACTVSLGIPGNPPFSSIENGQVTGVVAEVTVLALRNMGCRVQPRALPYARMYKWVHGGKLDVATAVRKTPERAALAHYSAPIISEYQLIMVPKDGLFPLRTLGDLAGMDIGGQLGTALSTHAFSRKRRTRFDAEISSLMTGRLWGHILAANKVPVQRKIWPLLEATRQP